MTEKQVINPEPVREEAVKKQPLLPRAGLKLETGLRAGAADQTEDTCPCCWECW